MTAVPTLIGFDYDSQAVFGAAIALETGEWLGSIHADLACGPGGSLERARRLPDLLPGRGAWAAGGVVAIGIEATLSRQRQTVAALSRVQGALLACLPRDVDLYPLKVNTLKDGWKVLTVGKTNATKPQVKAWALAHGAPAGLVQDFYDAFAIASATRSIIAATQAARTEGAA